MIAVVEGRDVEPGDAAARDRVRDDLGSTLFVQAAAGSGKTAALVSRVIALVDGGLAELREIAAITFTEAAATELRGRIAVALDAAVGDPTTAARRGLARLQLDEAPMTTIHGFAQRLLAEHPLEAGLPVRFDVADELVASVRRHERFDGFVDRLFDDPLAADLLRAATVLGVGVDRLEQIAGQMTDRFDGLRLPPEPPEIAPLVLTVVDAVRTSARKCLDHLGACDDPDDRLLARLVRLAAVVELPESDWLGALEWLVALAEEKGASGGRRTAWQAVDIEVVRADVVEYEVTRREAIAVLNDAVLNDVGRRMLAEARAFADERRATGGLFFHDLLVLTRDLLRDRPEIRAETRERYRYVLVDEFQDTDPLQFEILELFGSANGAGAPDPGRLFFVGDPMQSIYRFRGADVDLYRAVRGGVGGSGVVNLTTNFRSVPEICSFVTETFAHFVDDSDTPSIRLEPFRTAAEGQRVWAVGSGGDLRAPQRRATEAVEIVEAISAVVGSAMPVGDGSASRPARFGDVAVLVPNRTGLASLLRAFRDAGIEVRLSESALVYTSPEITEVLAIARAVEDRGDDRDVVSALRTGLLAIDDATLRAHVEGGGTWDLGIAGDDRRGEGSVLEAMGALRLLRDERAARGPSGTLSEIIDRFSAREIAASRRAGREALARIDFIVDRARAFEEAGGRTLGELLGFFALERRVGARVPTPIVDGADAVPILTVHGAKGLEFPIVALAELGGVIGSRPRPPKLLAADGRVELSLGAGRATAGYAELAAREAEADRREAIRLAYVAATRACDYLVVSLHHRARDADPPDSIAALLSSVVDLPPPPPAPPVVSRPGDLQPPEELTRSELDAYCERWRVDSGRAARLRSVTPSALEAPGPAATDPAKRTSEGEDDDPVDWRRARAASGIGRAVHAVLQRIELCQPSNIDELSARFSAAEGIGEYADVVSGLVLAATRAPIVRAAASSPSLRRELPLTLETSDGFVEGVVDLCFAGVHGSVIVDYKTDVVADRDEAAARAARYRLQAGAYAWAVGEISGRPVERVVFLFLSPPDGSIEVEVNDLQGAIAETRDAVRRAMADAGSALGHDRGR